MCFVKLTKYVWKKETANILDMEINNLCKSTAFWQCKLVSASVNLNPCYSANLLNSLQFSFFYKSIFKKSHLVWQTTLNRNNAAKLILLISLNREHSMYFGAQLQRASEWGQIPISCCSHVESEHQVKNAGADGRQQSVHKSWGKSEHLQSQICHRSTVCWFVRKLVSPV